MSNKDIDTECSSSNNTLEDSKWKDSFDKLLDDSRT